MSTWKGVWDGASEDDRVPKQVRCVKRESFVEINERRGERAACLFRADVDQNDVSVPRGECFRVSYQIVSFPAPSFSLGLPSLNLPRSA